MRPKISVLEYRYDTSVVSSLSLRCSDDSTRTKRSTLLAVHAVCVPRIGAGDVAPRIGVGTGNGDVKDVSHKFASHGRRHGTIEARMMVALAACPRRVWEENGVICFHSLFARCHTARDLRCSGGTFFVKEG